MKKIVSLLLIICALLLVSCGNKYPPVESSEKEATVLFTVTADGKEYGVKYELYRALFLEHKSEVDGGDATVWSGDTAAEYVARINDIIIPKIADIYATIRLAEKIGVDFDSKEIKKIIDGFIEESIYGGGAYANDFIEGYGSYDKYLEGLRSLGLNYSVQILLYHYGIAQSKIAEYYIGTLNEDYITPDATPGNLEYTPEDVKAFYDSNECVRVLSAFIQTEVKDAEDIRGDMINATSAEGVGDVIAGRTTSTGEEAHSGMIIGRFSHNPNHYYEFTQTAFSLNVGEVSEVIKVVTGDDNGFYVLYRTDKSDEHFENSYATVLSSYLNNEIGKMLNELSVEIMDSISHTDAYRALSHGDISMD